MLRSQKVDLVFPYFLIFIFIFIFIFLFLGLRVIVSDDITQSHISHIKWHGDSHSHKSWDAWKDIEYSGRNDIIQCVIHMLTLRYIHGHLG